MAVNQQKLRLCCHHLTPAALIDPMAQTATLMSLARTVFGPNDPDFEDPNHWKGHIEKPGVQVFYVTEESGTLPLGFFLGLPWTQPELGFETLHISQAAVDEAARGSGVFPLLLNESRKYARALGIETLTICTYPARFEKMYRILTGNGWEEIARRAKPDGEQVLFKAEA